MVPDTQNDAFESAHAAATPAQPGASYPAAPDAAPPAGGYGYGVSPYATYNGGFYGGNNAGYGAYSGYAYGGGAYAGGAAYGGGGAYALATRRGAAAAAGVLGGVQDAMARFARVSAVVDDALRSLHLLFDALFGLGMAIRALAKELRTMGKTVTPATYLAKQLRRIVRVLVAAGRLSPLGILLRLLGFAVPAHPAARIDIDAAWRDASDAPVEQVQEMAVDEVVAQIDSEDDDIWRAMQ